MKSQQAPRSVVAAILAASSAVAIVSANTFPFAQPTFRFSPFHNLDPTSRNIAEAKLGYLEVTWNVHGLAPIERKGWRDLTTNERDGASQLGFTEMTWDCFINHYERYTWDELEEKGVQDYYRGLGWTQHHWEETADTLPATESRWWDMLTDNEKKAANGLCYFVDNWDKTDMNPNDGFFPHPMPSFRYIPWGELDSVTKNVASGMLNYTDQLWDNLGTSVAEKNTFLNLESEERAGALELGFYTHTWDCFMNHYLSYYWSSFHEDLRVAVETLGWTEEMWSGEAGVVPASESKVWADLTNEERAAATRLCYFKETWDDESISNWYDWDAGVPTAVDSKGPLPDDIDLTIFEGTGYNGRDPEIVGVPVAAPVQGATAEKSSSPMSFVSAGVLFSVLVAGSLLLV